MELEHEAEMRCEAGDSVIIIPTKSPTTMTMRVAMKEKNYEMLARMIGRLSCSTSQLVMMVNIIGPARGVAAL